MKTLFGCVAAFLLAAASLKADPPERRTEISILVGVSLLDVTHEGAASFPERLSGIPLPFLSGVEFRERQTLGGSPLMGFKVGRYLGERAELELAVLVGPSHDLRSESFFTCDPGGACALRDQLPPSGRPPIFQTRQNVAAYYYDLNLTYDLARGDVRPFLTFGAGGVSSDTAERVETAFAFNFGAGAKLYFGKIGARLELGDHVVTHHFVTGKAEHDVQVRGGVVFRLP